MRKLFLLALILFAAPAAQADGLTDRLQPGLQARHDGPEGQAYRAKQRREQVRRVARYERRFRMAALRYELSAVRRWQVGVRRALRD